MSELMYSVNFLGEMECNCCYHKQTINAQNKVIVIFSEFPFDIKDHSQPHQVQKGAA